MFMQIKKEIFIFNTISRNGFLINFSKIFLFLKFDLKLIIFDFFYLMLFLKKFNFKILIFEEAFFFQ